MGLPSYAVTFRGKPACPCLAAWLPVYESELQRRGQLAGDLTIYQLIGGAAASGGTHASGGAFDISDLIGDADVLVAREMGALATWARTSAQGFVPHLHGVLNGCPHNEPARYQINDVLAGWNGLAGTSRAPDDGPREPLTARRTWREGIAWAKELGDDMPRYTDWAQADKNALAADIAKAVLEAKPDGSTKSLGQLVKETLNKVKALR